MILLLISLVAITIINIYFSHSYNDFLSFVGVMGAALGMLGLIVYSVLINNYISAGYQANIINKEYGTNYTQKDVFYASNVIDTIQELKRSRIELKSNLLEQTK